MKSKEQLFQKIVDETPLEVKLRVGNEMAFIDLLTELGFRKDEMWDDNNPEDRRILNKLFEHALKHTFRQMKDVEKSYGIITPQGWEK